MEDTKKEEIKSVEEEKKQEGAGAPEKTEPAKEAKKEEKKEVRSETKPFVHLHVHTDMSLLDGAARLTKGKHFPLLEAAIAKGMP